LEVLYQLNDCRQYSRSVAVVLALLFKSMGEGKGTTWLGLGATRRTFAGCREDMSFSKHANSSQHLAGSLMDLLAKMYSSAGEKLITYPFPTKFFSYNSLSQTTSTLFTPEDEHLYPNRMRRILSYDLRKSTLYGP
jgi:hypothetical protein